MHYRRSKASYGQPGQTFMHLDEHYQISCVGLLWATATVPDDLMLPIIWWAKVLTSWPASSGIYSMMASRTLHLASSASSTMAGRRDWESWRIPITSFTQSKLEMIFKRTSGHCKNTYEHQGLCQRSPTIMMRLTTAKHFSLNKKVLTWVKKKYSLKTNTHYSIQST